jgi:multiple sugar transport system permease protein
VSSQGLARNRTLIPKPSTRTKPEGRHSLKESLAGFVYVAPASLLFLVFVLAPLVGTLVLAFVNWGLLGTVTPAGFSNFTKLFSDSEFGEALLNTLYFAVASSAVHLVLGLGLGLLVVNMKSRVLSYFARTAIVLPFLISAGSVALVAQYVLSSDFGPLNYYLEKLGMSPPNWLESPVWAMPALVGVDVWQTIGFTFIIFLVGLQGIPQQYYEAASLDGAGPFRRFTNVTLPLLSPTIFLASILSFIGAFQVFTWPDIITQGGPGHATETLVYYIYKQAFQNFDLGYGAAIGVVVIVILVIVTGIQFYISRRLVNYDRT